MAYWLPRHIETLSKLWAEGATATEIARQLGDPFTRNAVIGKAYRLDLPRRPSPIGQPIKPGWPA